MQTVLLWVNLIKLILPDFYSGEAQLHENRISCQGIILILSGD